jgi:hypothetical protein
LGKNAVKRAVLNGKKWVGISVSATGQYQSAIQNNTGSSGGVYRSDDYGRAWSTAIVSGDFRAISVSASGQYQIGVVHNNHVHTSSDYGSSFSTTNVTGTAATQVWSAVAMSASGQYRIVMIANTNGGYRSADYGSSWTLYGSTTLPAITAITTGTSIRAWSSVSMSASGQYQTAVSSDASSYIYVSSDYGLTWVAKTPQGVWNCVAVSATGQYQTCVGTGIATKSSDYGISFSISFSTSTWNSVSMSATGQYQIASGGSLQLYVTINYGVAWTLTGTAYAEGSVYVSLSASGQYATIVVNSGVVYTCVLPTAVDHGGLLLNGIGTFTEGNTTDTEGVLMRLYYNATASRQLQILPSDYTAASGSLRIIPSLTVNEVQIDVIKASEAAGTTSGTLKLGTTEVYGTLTTGNTKIIGTLDVSGNTSVTGTNTLTVGTGATTLSGTLTVTGGTTLGGTTLKSDMKIIGGKAVRFVNSADTWNSLSIVADMTVDKRALIMCDDLRVVGANGGNNATTLTGTLDVYGNTSVTGVNTFTVGTGATTLGGTLAVAGATIHTGTTALNGNVTIAAGKTLTVGTGATTLGGKLTVDGATILNNTLLITSAQVEYASYTAKAYVEIKGYQFSSRSVPSGTRFMNNTVTPVVTGYEPSGTVTATTGIIPIGLLVDQAIWTQNSLFVTSDIRIKKNLSNINDGDALNALRKIEPTEYEYIDALRGNSRIYGFIAQQVREHFPQAVSIQRETIPNIYSVADYSLASTIPITTYSAATSSFQNTSQYIYTLNVSSGILSSLQLNSTLRLYDPYNTQINGTITYTDYYSTVQMTVDKAPKLKDDPAHPGKIFVYGTEVNDLHILNKDYLFTMNFAATQELDRKCTAQQSTITSLTTMVYAQQSTIDAILRRIM